MKSTDALLDSWRHTLSRAKDRPAILTTHGQILRKFRDIEEGACKFEPKLEMLRPGSVIAIQIGNHEDWPSILIACLRTHLVVLPLEQSVNDQQRNATLELCKARAVVSAVPSGAAPDISRLRTADATPDWGENPPSLLKLTSGTTAAPRAIRFRSHQLLADCNQICDTMKITGADLNFGVIPISHSYGFSNLLTPSKLRLCISAGAPLPRTVAKKFREKFNLPIHSFYGSSECGGICYDREATNETEGFVGRPMKGVGIEVLEPNASACQVQVRSAAVGDGYFPEPDEEKLGDGAFVPDDLLARDDSGFKIVGRISDVINVAGKKVNPEEVEAHLLRFSGVRQAVVFGRPAAAGVLRNEEVAACVAGSRHLTEEGLLRFCRTALSAWQVPKRIFVVDAIPMNERGKISRRDLARRFSTPGASPPL